jgi:hypothetical protein
MPCRNPCKLDFHLAFTYFVSPSSVMWSGLGPAQPSPPLRVLEIKWSRALRATSHTTLKAPDHGNVRALIGRKGGDRPSSIHTRRRRPKGPKKKFVLEKSTWSPTWQVVDKGAWSNGICMRPTSWRRASRKFREIMTFLNVISSMTNFRTNSRIDPKTYKYQQITILNR